MSLETSLGLNNEYAGLYGEVVEYDVYHLRDVPNAVSVNDPTYVHWYGHSGIDFVPDTVVDLGANVGVFTRYASSLWPDTKIISVEPNPDNCRVFREYTHSPNVTLIEAAVGRGQVYHSPGANGAMEVYLTKSIGFPLLAGQDYKTVMLTDLTIKGKSLLKIDIEGNETVIFSDPKSVEMMKTFDYICMELHYYGVSSEAVEEVRKKTDEVLESFKETHNTRYDHIYFYARKK